jgi:hypothetical protein
MLYGPVGGDREVGPLAVNALVTGRVTVSRTDRVTRVSQFWLIMSRLRPRLRGRPWFLAGWPARGMDREISRR